MTADFENDEIKDSSFPIDFKDEAETLDMYGVWVKSGPRDAIMGTRDKAPASSVESAFTEDLASDISALPDFPDFLDSNADLGAVPETESVSFDETLESTGLEGPEIMDFGDLETPSEPLKDSDTGSSEEFSIESLDDISFDSLTIPSDETVSDERANALPEDEPLSADIGSDFEDIAIQDYSFEPVQEEPAVMDEDVLDEADFLEPEIELSKPVEDAAVPAESAIPETDELERATTEEFSVDDFLSPSSESPAGEIGETPSEEDFSSFLDDLNTSTPARAEPAKTTGSASDDFDLDSLINTVNEAGSLEQEKEKLFDDTEPLDIDLEFDESFIEDAEKIKATGSAVSESEFFNSEFGVELVDETAGGSTEARSSTESSMDFDSMFAAVEEETEVQTARGGEPDSASSFLEETSEFDDLLQSLDAAPVPAPVSDKGKSAIPSSKGFDLAVTEEDTLESISTSVSESTVDEDFSVSLFGGESVSAPKAEEKNAFFPAHDAKAETISDEEFEALIEPSVPDEPESGEIDVPLMNEEAPLVETESLISETEPEITENANFLEADTGFETSPETGKIEEIVDLNNFKDYNSSESGQESEISEMTSVEEPVSLDFDDISAVEKDLNEDNPVTGDTTVVTNDKSTELLMIIADELSSIKKEISTLKSELAGFKNAPATEALNADIAGSQTENSGFFSDDDTDETIALTGDELNNILITADFTEEKSEEETQEEPSLTVGPEEPIVMESETDVTISGLHEVGEIQPEASEPEIPETLPETIFDVPGFEEAEAVEVSHVNTINDDMSYLEGSDAIEADLDNVAIEEPELEIIDFEDEKLEEPELTEFNIDLTEMESDYPHEQEIAVESASPEALSAIEKTVEPSVDEFATTETLSNEELASIGEDVSGTLEADNAPKTESAMVSLPVDLKDEIKSVLSYMDQLLESLPEDKIEEFARSEHFEVYKKLFEELGIS